MKDITEKIKEKFNEFIDDGKKEIKKVKKTKDLIKQLPNLFTISRLFLVPFIVGNILTGNLIGAGLISLGASLTDFIDGKLARKLNVVSKFGANLDAFVDKLFVTFVTIPLFYISPALILPVLLDMAIAAINGYAHVKEIEIKTSKIGKIKTLFLDSLICSIFFKNVSFINHLSKILYLTTVTLQAKTAKEYHKTYLAKKREKETIIKKNQLIIKDNPEKEIEKTKIHSKTNYIENLKIIKKEIEEMKNQDKIKTEKKRLP